MSEGARVEYERLPQSQRIQPLTERHRLSFMQGFPEIEDLYEQYVDLGWRIVSRMVASRGGCREETMDVLQDAWMRVVQLRNDVVAGIRRAYPTGDASNPEWKSLLCTIFRSTAIDYLRGNGHRIHCISLNEHDEEYLVAPSPSPGEAMEMEDL